MTPTDKQKCIAEQAVYGDFRGYDLKDTYYREHHSTIVGFQNKLVYIGCDLNRIEAIKPILRPMSDLTKEITHKGYNDDKPFVPMMKIAKILYGCDFNYEFGISEFGIDVNIYNGETYLNSTVFRIDKCSISVFDLLFEWHFDTRNLIDKGEAIDVNTLPNNPYSV